MTEYGTIKIPREDYARHNERRQALGVTWAAYLDGEAPPDVVEAVADAVDDRLDARLADLRADLEAVIQREVGVR